LEVGGQGLFLTGSTGLSGFLPSGRKPDRQYAIACGEGKGQKSAYGLEAAPVRDRRSGVRDSGHVMGGFRADHEQIHLQATMKSEK